MINLVSRHPNEIAKLVGVKTYRRYFGLLTSPRIRFKPENAISLGAKWAMDNDCFVAYDSDAIERALKRYQYLPNCVFAVVPDKVQNADITLLMFRAWLGTYKRLGFPVAFVAQDGIENISVPYDSFDVLFIGGSDEFKSSLQLLEVVNESQKRQKWVHHGRVNWGQRLAYTRGILKADSFDGTASLRPERILEIFPYQVMPSEAAAMLSMAYKNVKTKTVELEFTTQQKLAI